MEHNTRELRIGVQAGDSGLEIIQVVVIAKAEDKITKGEHVEREGLCAD